MEFMISSNCWEQNRKTAVCIIMAENKLDLSSYGFNPNDNSIDTKINYGEESR